MKKYKSKVAKYTSLLLGEEYENLTINEILKIADDKFEPVMKRWEESIKENNPDFSVYHHKDYIWDNIICYARISKNSIYAILKFLEKNNIDFKNMSWFDDYNGLGITTLEFAQAGVKNIEFFNDVDVQIKSTEKLFKYHEIKPPKNNLSRNGKYDIVCSLEVVEHYQNPIEYLDTICDMVNDDGYLMFSTTGTLFVGHFLEYNFGDKIVKNKKFTSEVTNYIESKGFTKISRGIGQKPIIFVKKKTNSKKEKDDLIKSYNHVINIFKR